MKKIPLNAKILCLTHNDLDAATATIILANTYKNIEFIYNSFWKIDAVMQYVDYSKYDYVFVIDIHPEKRSNLYVSDNIILLDHHETAKEYHNPKKMHFVAENMCAAKLTKKFIENMYGTKLSHLDNLVYLTNDYDLYTLNNPKSKLMNDLMFYYYRPIKFRKEFIDGRTRFNEKEIKWLHERRKEFNKRWKELEVFEFKNVNGCLVNANYFLNEIAHKLMEEEGYNIVFVRNPDNERISIRQNIEEFNVGTYVKSLGIGGGHRFAAGIQADNMNDLQKKIKEINDFIYKNYEVARI